MLTRLRGSLTVVLLLLLPRLTSAQMWLQVTPVATGNDAVDNQYHAFSPMATVSDAAGNVYVTGSLRGTFTFGNTTLTGAIDPYGDAAFIGKLSPTGAWLWAVTTPQDSANGWCMGKAIALDPSGNVLVGGEYRGRVSIGPVNFNNHINAFAAKLSPTGSWQWVAATASTFSGTNYSGRSAAYCIGSDAQGNVFLAGQITGELNFGSIVLSTPQPANGFGSQETFVAKLTPAGTWQWAKASTSTPAVASTSNPDNMVVDAAGNVTVQGQFSQNSTFGATTLTRTDTTARAYDIYVTRLSPAGTWLWATAADSPAGESIGSDFTLAPNGQLLLTGAISNATRFGATTLTNPITGNTAGFLAALTPATGAWQWTVSTADTVPMVQGVTQLVADASGHILVARGGGRRFGTAYVTRYSATGNEQWRTPIRTPGSGSLVGVTALEIAGPDEVRLTGAFRNTAAFGPISVTSSDSLSLFLAHLNTRPVGLPDELSAAPFHLSPNPAHLTATLTGAAPRTRFTVLDALGRTVMTATADATGAAPLDVRVLPAGLYLVRADGRAGARRLVVE